jgi:diguanylate cyclase (GGDEF)-like protein
LEFAEYGGYYYGTSRSEVEEILKKGIDVFLIKNVDGVKQILEAEFLGMSRPRILTIFVKRQPDEKKNDRSKKQKGKPFVAGNGIADFFAVALYLWYFLVKPLSLLLDGIRNFTRGKTDVRIPAIGKDELGELQEAFNEMSTEINVERRRLTTESQSDSLTSLFNMRYFRRQLVEEFSRSQRYNHPLSLLMIDVDHFKSYNDRNGHPAGDIVLKEVSRILIRNVRGTDIVARYGGEEFVVLLPETPADAATSVAEKIRKTVEEHHFPFRETQSGGRLTVSIGVGSFPDPRVTSDQDMIESADKALYSAKQNGRNQVRVFLKGETTSPLNIISPAVSTHSAAK